MKPIIIENSLAPNAIGDSVAAFPALYALGWNKPLQVYFSAEKVRDLFFHPKIELLTERPEDGEVIDVQKLFSIYAHTGLSLTRSYMMALGLDVLAKSQYLPEIHFNVGPERAEKIWDFIIAPFSWSDNGTNTKLWYEYCWILLVQELKKNKFSVGLMGTQKDYDSMSEEFKKGICDLVDPILDQNLIEVCKILRDAKIVITVDNGINWLAQGMDAAHILLVPNTHHPNWTANPSQFAVNLPVNSRPENVYGAIQHLIKTQKR